MISAYVLRGEGISPQGAEHLAAALKHQNNDTILADISEIKRHLTGRLPQHEHAVMVIPGGHSLEIGANLHRLDAKQWIKRFLDQGGGYLGICAGANLASRSIYYSYEGPLGDPIDITDIPTLDLLPVSALGPAFDPFTTDLIMDPKQSVLAQLSTPNGDRAAYNCHGAYFVPIRSAKNEVNILARYDAQRANRPAVLMSHFGRGKVVISGVHPELNPTSTEETLAQTTMRNTLMREMIAQFNPQGDQRCGLNTKATGPV